MTSVQDLISPVSLSKNYLYLSNIRSFTSALSGLTAGILGLQGWIAGIGFYILISVLTSSLRHTRCLSSKYFASKTDVWISGVFENMLSFLLWWTLAYGLVYVYD